jgi:hypothetical protein
MHIFLLAGKHGIVRCDGKHNGSRVSISYSDTLIPHFIVHMCVCLVQRERERERETLRVQWPDMPGQRFIHLEHVD